MSFLPKKETDILSLVNAGYTITYTDSGNELSFLDLDDDYIRKSYIMETVQKNGIVCAPSGEPAVKYFDRESGNLVAASWHNVEGKFHRKNAPAFVYQDDLFEVHAGKTKYVVLRFYENGNAHNEDGPASVYECTRNGKTVREREDHYLRGECTRFLRRDSSTGNVTVELSPPT